MPDTGMATRSYVRATALSVVLLTIAVLPRPALAQRDFAKVEITAEQAGPGVYMLKGAGGNLGVCVGPDGVILIDDQFAPLSDKILAAIAKLSDKPVRFVVNTHWHGDHTGGNENMGKAGAVLVAQANVRRRMSVVQFNKTFNDTTPASPAGALPVVTFSDSVAFHLNGQDIEVIHVGPAHTDGDAIIWFKEANVVHMGDVFFNGLYPFVDTSSGGSTRGYVKAIDSVLPLLGPDTKVIPGHGPMSNRDGLKEFRDVMAGIADAVQKAIDAGKTREETIALKPTAPWDAKWGGGFMKPDMFTGVVYDDLSRGR